MRRILTLVIVFSFACNSKTPETTSGENEIPERETQSNSSNKKGEEKPEEAKSLDLVKEPTYVAFNFLDNRPLSHNVYKNTFFVDASSEDFVKYIHGNHQNNWKINTDIEGEKAAVMKKTRTAKIWIPGPKDAKTISFRILNTNPNPEKLTITLNDTKLETQKVEKGWQTLSFDTKGASKLENEVELSFAGFGKIKGILSGGALQWVALGQENKLDFKLTTGSQGKVELVAKQKLAWHVWALKNAFIRVDFESKDACPVAIEIQDESGKIKTSRFVPDVKLGERQKGSFALGEMNEKVVRVVVGPVGDCGTTIHELSMGMEGKLPEVPRVEPPKYVLFWMVDTLRADRLPIHFKTDVEAPELKRLAKEGVSFELVYVQGNESKTSHASVFTALYPNRHKVVGKGKVNSAFKIMPEAIKAEGYKTGANIANGYISKPWGFVQGWDMYLNNLREGHTISGQRMAKKAAKWFIAQKEKKTFMYVGTIDPHVTYHRHDDIIKKYYPEDYSGKYSKGCSGQDLGLIKGKKIKVNAKDKKRIEALYKNEITFSDQAFGIMRKELEEAGMWDKTLVVVSSDHGDEFWEHGNVGHGHSVYEQLVHVPLILHYPPLFSNRSAVKSGADSIDIYPTIIDIIGGKRPSKLQGQSLLPSIFGNDGGYPNPAISTSYLRDYGLQIRQWKLYLKRGGFRVFDRANDPQEKKNVAVDHPFATRWLLDSVGWFRHRRSRWDKASDGSASNLKPGFYN